MLEQFGIQTYTRSLLKGCAGSAQISSGVVRNGGTVGISEGFRGLLELLVVRVARCEAESYWGTRSLLLTMRAHTIGKQSKLGKDSSAPPSDLSKGTIYGVDQSQSPKKAASTLLSLKNRLSPRVDFFAKHELTAQTLG